MISPSWSEPWLLHEDDEILVVSKPAGVATAGSGMGVQDGMLEWVQRQRPDASLSILEHLHPENPDTTTAGVLVFGKTPNTSLSAFNRIHTSGLADSSEVDSPADDPCARLRKAHTARTMLFDPGDTDAYQWVDRDHDGFPDLRVERLGRVALVLDYRDDGGTVPSEWLDAMGAIVDLDGVYVQHRPRRGIGEPARRVSGQAGPAFDVSELGVRYRVDLGASPTSSGLFLDQRETRRELLMSNLLDKTMLNTFAHTGAISVAAALAGAETLTLDLSKHYLDWARQNLELNDVDPGDHDFVYGDALEWMDRFAKKGRRFDVVVVDPPTSSTARKGSKRWTVTRDLDRLVALAADLGAANGRIYVSTNSRKMSWNRFIGQVDAGLDAAGRRGDIDTRTLPLDHRSNRGDPPYLKAAWIYLD